jgi:hypothetical protein
MLKLPFSRIIRSLRSETMSHASTRPRRRDRARQAIHRAAMEGLEQRMLLSAVTLSNGTGPGTLQLTVDGHGAYGIASGGGAGDATYQPASSGVPAGTTYESGVFFGPLGDFLSEGSLALSTQIPAAFTSTTTSSAVSTFGISTSAGPYAVRLTQTVQPQSADGTRFDQTYEFTNNTGSDQTIFLTRHVDGDMSFVGGLGDDFAGVTGDGRFVFEFDTANDPSASTGFFGITSSGTLTPVGYTIQPYLYYDSIRTAGGIPTGDLNQINGDANGNRLTDQGYDVTVSLEDRLTIAAGQTVSWTTSTIFGQGSPQDITAAGSLQFAQPVYDLDEGVGTATITVNRVGGDAGTVSVDYATNGGTATPGSDYGAVSGTLTFPDGVTSQTITLAITEDMLAEANENFLLTLSNPTGGGVVGAPNPAQINILDNDRPGIIELSQPSYDFMEDAGTANIVVNRINGNVGTVTVDYVLTANTATAGADYTDISGTLTFASGQSSATIAIPLLDDTTLEPTESLGIRLTNITGGATIGPPREATINIVEDDSLFQFASPTYAMNEDGGLAYITVTRSGDLSFAADVNYGTSGGDATPVDDYTPTSGTLHFDAGVSALYFTVPLLDDQLEEPTETFNLSLENGTGGTLTGEHAVFSIVNADHLAPTIQSLQLVPDGNRIQGLVVNFSEPMQGMGTIDHPDRYTILAPARHGTFTTVPIESASYDPATQALTLLPARPLKANTIYQFLLNGNTDFRGVTDMAGNGLDTNADGVGGDTYRTQFARGNRITYHDANGDKVNLRLKRGGMMNFFQGFDGVVDRVTLSDIVAGRSMLTGTVKKSRHEGDGITTIENLINSEDVRNQLRSNLFSIQHIA